MATFYFNAAQDNEWTSLASYATGTISFSGQPADAELVNIDGNTFEFDSDSSSTGTAVVIGGTLADTLANLAAAIEAAAIGISATVNGTDIDLVATSAGPNPFVSSDSLVVTTADMTGGAVGNWWTDADCTVQATSLPTSADDVVVKPLLNGFGFNTNSGSAPTIASLSGEFGSLGIYIDMTITGDAGAVYEVYQCTVTAGSMVITGFLDTATVIGNVTFKGAENVSPYGNFGTVDGNATFDEYSINSFTGIVTGDATFNDFSTQSGTVGGNATFNDSSINYGTVTGDATFNGISYNNGTVTGDATVNGISYNNYGTVSGNATFNDFSYNNSTVTGDATFNGISYNLINGTVSGDATFNDSSGNSGTVTGNATFNDSTTLREYSSVGGNVTFSEIAVELTLNNLKNFGLLDINLNYGSIIDVDATTIIQLRGVNGSSILGVV